MSCRAQLRGERTMSLTKMAVVATILTWLLAMPVLAAETGGIKIGGSVEQKADVGTATVVAIGQDAKAGQSIAAIHSGTEVKGSVKQTATVKTATVVAIGKNTQACQSIASMGESAACR